ncbi:MAG TPA: coniferyl-alcohol dehydrogenase [Gaiellaceae bacterium]|jgi:NAD(P)-dependent dehydrogenase (short-subunit alcohol dehydrogenase family)
MLPSYAGKRVVVAGGGGSGMGASVARIVGELGGEVHVLDLREPSSPVASFVRTDLGDPAGIAESVGRLGGPVHALFNCQGISGTAPGTSSADVLRVNFLGVRHLTELVLPLVPAGGAVASISSVGGLGWQQRLADVLELLETDGFDDGLAWVEEQARGGFLAEVFPTSYAFSKEALIVYTMRRCVTSIAAGVRINCSSPGATATSMAPDFPAERVAVTEQPAGRKASPDEQALPLVFLCSGAAGYVNGANLVVDGGNAAARMFGLVPDPAAVGQR